jgi:dihydrofolate synthase/folylpolyglutamate synthase
MKVDYAVIETGMGGRLDSTNIISPQVSVITNIGLDHTRFLGETHEQIAREKAGIIKEGIAVVIGEKHPDTLPVFMKTAREKNAPIFIAEERFAALMNMMQKDRSINLTLKDRKTGEEIVINTDLTGNYQHKNIVTLLQTLEVLQEKGLGLSEYEILKGLKNVKRNTGLRGRWEEVAYNPLIVCDTAHNAEGISLVMEQLQNIAFRKLHIIWGMVSDKNPGKILKLLPKNAIYYFTKADIPRSMDESMLYEMANEHKLEGRTYRHSAEALKAAQGNAEPEDVIFIGGSTFLVGELLKD